MNSLTNRPASTLQLFNAFACVIAAPSIPRLKISAETAQFFLSHSRLFAPIRG